ncbi:MAG: exonuclease domain-containing protein [Raineya sp.]|nr:exonuclease domain-containing protein [Raineya sp.]MDW8295597.1 exonuclease domain-containing protein [Raineya sp.]
MFAIVDIETTGSKPDYDKIIEIAIYLHDGEKIVDSFCTLVNPERYIPDFITKLTGISNAMVADAPRFYEIAKKIVQFTEGHIFVAHNVHFDYSFLKNEFRSLGYNYQRQTLCTVRLSRKLIPNLPSYSLGKLCESLGIKIQERHRAKGDAEATAQIFTRLVQINRMQVENDVIEAEIKFPTLPPKISYEQVADLPEETGVYYFHDEKGAVIYVGKSRNIRKRIASHFQLFSKNRKHSALKETIADISYEITGSELVALLLESAEIKKYKPRFNKAQRRDKYLYGIFVRKDSEGYLRLYADKIKTEKMPIYFTESGIMAKIIIEKYQQKYNLCQKLCDMYRHSGACFGYRVGECAGACVCEEPIETYNSRVEQVIAHLSQFKKPNFCIIGKGRTHTEKSLVWVENGLYCGFGFVDMEDLEDINNVQKLKQFIQKQPDNKDAQKIIRQYLETSQDKVFYF